MSENAIDIHGITKEFGNTRALDQVDFSIPQGGVCGLLGPNGAGKTTLFALIAGFLKPKAGKIEVLGIDVERIGELRGRLSILPQDAQFASNVPIIEQVIFFSQLSGRERRAAEEEAERALEMVGLAEVAKKSARTLSHGMYKRLGLAQAFLGTPEVILLDEPTAGLDPASAAAMRQLIEELRSSSTLVVSSHNLAEIQQMCDSVAILDRGRLVEHSSVKDITQADTIQRMTFARPLTDEEQATLRGVSGVTDLAQDGETSYRVTLDPSERAQDEIVSDVVEQLVKTGAVPRSIEDGVALESKFLEVTTAPVGSGGGSPD